MSLKQAIEERLKIPTNIKMGAPGSLDVFVDGRLIFSKKQAGRMPTNDEILSALQPQT